jgi:hypothetical protein
MHPLCLPGSPGNPVTPAGSSRYDNSLGSSHLKQSAILLALTFVICHHDGFLNMGTSSCLILILFLTSLYVMFTQDC